MCWAESVAALWFNKFKLSESAARAVMVKGVAESAIEYDASGSPPESHLGFLLTNATLYQPVPFEMYNLFVALTNA